MNNQDFENDCFPRLCEVYDEPEIAEIEEYLTKCGTGTYVSVAQSVNLEAPELWSEVHSRLIVLLADALSEQLSDAYRVATEKRTYLSEVDESLMVGIPDILVVTQQTQPRANVAPTTAVLSDVIPKTVTVPIAEEVQERDSEISGIM